jgi:hypothetical protein
LIAAKAAPTRAATRSKDAAYTAQWPSSHELPEFGRPPTPDRRYAHPVDTGLPGRDRYRIDVTRKRGKTAPSISCDNCDAVCCRLTVILMPEDRVPNRFVVEDERGTRMLAKGEDGWCQALDLNTMRCTIYGQRPVTCRKFAMGGPYCRSERDAWRGIALTLVS